MKTWPNLVFFLVVAIAGTAAVAALMAGAHALGKRRRGPWLIERGTP